MWLEGLLGARSAGFADQVAFDFLHAVCTECTK